MQSGNSLLSSSYKEFAKILVEYALCSDLKFDNFVFSHQTLLASHPLYLERITEYFAQYGIIKYTPFHDENIHAFYEQNSKTLQSYLETSFKTNIVHAIVLKYACLKTCSFGESRNRFGSAVYYTYNDADIMWQNNQVCHLYHCSIPEYVKFCLTESIKRRAKIAMIYDENNNPDNSETFEFTPINRILSDECVVSTIVKFL